MENDNIYIGSVSRTSFTPQVKSKDIQKEIKDTLDQLPLLRKTVNRLDAKILEADSITNALLVAKDYKTTTDNALIGLNILKQNLEAERRYIMARIEKAR